MDTNTNVVYRIDSQDRIVFVNNAWQQFALANDAADYTDERVLNRSIWDFITDDPTRLFYQEMVKRVRTNNSLSFNFRCDSSEYRRFMKMKISSAEGNEVQFESQILSSERRNPQAILDRRVKRSDELVVICGWCKKINIGQAIWKEIEHAVEVLGIFESEIFPQLSHGMCGGCYTSFFEQFRKQYG